MSYDTHGACRIDHLVLVRPGADPPVQSTPLSPLFAMSRIREAAFSSDAHRILELANDLGELVSWGLDAHRYRTALEAALRRIVAAFEQGRLIAFEPAPFVGRGAAGRSGRKTPAPSPPPKPAPSAAPAPAPAKKAVTITSQTVATSPAVRARTRVGVGEEVDLTVSPDPATWTIISGRGTLTPSAGSVAKVTFAASDAAGSVTIKATAPSGDATITLTVVEPSSWSMERKPGSSLRHTAGRPDCGWKGIMYVHPDDVNFYNIETREKDSQYAGTGSSAGANGTYHGNYPPPDGASDWFPITRHAPGAGSTDDVPDTIYSGDDPTATGNAPPFNAGSGHFPITMQWRVGTGAPKNFPVRNQEDEVFANGRCEMRKGGNTEHTMYNDAPSMY